MIRCFIMQQVRNGGFLSAHLAAALSQSASMFGWTSLDGIEIPFVQRSDGQTFFPVRIAERKFLSQFANINHFNVQNPLLSHYMYEAEALALTSSGCGEVFTSRDLLVNLEDFRRFFEQVKEKCTQDSSKKVTAVGGWVQINNTVVPYIIKDDSVMVPLAIVRCAAGLLVGRDVPVVFPAEDECRFLNDSCKSAGISFDFTTTTELVELVLMSCMCDQRPFVRQLPNGNPFSVAEAIAEEGSDKVSASTGVSGLQPSNPLPENTISVTPAVYTSVSCGQQPWLANGSNSKRIQIVDTHSLSQDVSEYKPEPSAANVSFESSPTQFPFPARYVFGRYIRPASVGPQNLPPSPNMFVTTAIGGSKPMPKDQFESSGTPHKYTDYQNALTFADQLRQQLTDTCKNNMQVTGANDSSREPPLVRNRTPPNNMQVTAANDSSREPPLVQNRTPPNNMQLTAANNASREQPLVRNRTPPNILARKTTQKRPHSQIDVTRALHESATDEVRVRIF